MNSTSVYVAATQKQKSTTSYFGVCVRGKRARKMKEYSGIYQGNSRMETQLKALIHGINLAEDADEVLLYSETKFLDSFLDGTVETWELADWCKGNGQPIDCMELWQELHGLIAEKNVKLLKPKAKKDMAPAKKLMDGEKNKPEIFTNLYLGSLSEKFATEEPVSELKQEEADLIVEEIMREHSADLDQTATDNLISKAKASAVASNAKEKESPKMQVAGKKLAEDKSSGLEISLDEKTLQECEALFQELGMDTETAVKIFLKQSLRNKAIPFYLEIK